VQVLRPAAALAAGLALIAGAAEAGGADCRRVAVQPAGCAGGAAVCHLISHARQPCFSVRGRLSVWNGAPTFRLHPDGSKRVLGVVGGDGDPASPSVLTPGLRAEMTPPAPGELNPVTAIFRVCPLAPDRPGRMRPVCIAGATGITPSPDAR
jgi:hypothetical protein